MDEIYCRVVSIRHSIFLDRASPDIPIANNKNLFTVSIINDQSDSMCVPMSRPCQKVI